MITMEIDVTCGTSIDKGIEEAQRLAKKLDVGIRFKFNGTTVFVSEDSDKNEVYNDWKRRFNRLK